MAVDQQPQHLALARGEFRAGIGRAGCHAHTGRQVDTAVEHPLQRAPHLLQVGGLGDEAGRAGLDRLQHQRRLVLRRQHHMPRPGRPGLQHLQALQALGVGQAQVEQHQGHVGVAVGQCAGASQAACLQHFQTGPGVRQQEAQRFAQQGVVIHQHQFQGGIRSVRLHRYGTGGAHANRAAPALHGAARVAARPPAQWPGRRRLLSPGRQHRYR